VAVAETAHSVRAATPYLIVLVIYHTATPHPVNQPTYLMLAWLNTSRQVHIPVEMVRRLHVICQLRELLVFRVETALFLVYDGGDLLISVLNLSYHYICGTDVAMDENAL
jgi:hypothetical protein